MRLSSLPILAWVNEGGTMDKKILATIELDNGEGEGRLFWTRGYIHCFRVFDGSIWSTVHQCSQGEALATIKDVWGESIWCLDIIEEG